MGRELEPILYVNGRGILWDEVYSRETGHKEMGRGGTTKSKHI